MDTALRQPYQGVFNIIRFNWHFYFVAGVFLLLLLTLSIYLDDILFWICIIAASGIVGSTVISLAVSYYVYDYSGLYDFTWLKDISSQKPETVANIHAGFDETSLILQRNFASATLHVADFYDPDKHTEVSIERARRAHPPFPGTIKVGTNHLPFAKGSIDMIFNIFALHEVRDRHERISFLQEQGMALKENGTCIIVEHLRDLPNFLAYNVGFFHFHSEREWKANFSLAGLRIEKKFKITRFISVFILKKINGNTH